MARKPFVWMALFCGWTLLADAADIARVAGRPITDRELQLSLGGFNEKQRENYLKDPNSRNQALSNLIDRELLVIQAERSKVDQTAEFREAAAQFRKQYLANVVLEKAIAPKMTEASAKAYYKTFLSRYTTDRVRAQHVLVPTEAEARNVLQLAKKPDADFQALAEKYSIDPSAKNNRGELAFFQRDSMAPEFTDPVFAAKVGDIIGPIKTLYGYHVVKVIERKPGTQLTYDEVELRVKGEMRKDVVNAYLAELRKGVKINVTPVRNP
jgi:peptidyl-prolyl cis-trans isomerase C